MGSKIEVEHINGFQVVSPRGDLDAFTAPPLRDGLFDLIDHEGARRLVIDLTHVTFLDSTALGALVAALRRMRENEGSLVIVPPASEASRIFELTGLSKVLDLRSTREAALASTP